MHEICALARLTSTTNGNSISHRPCPALLHSPALILGRGSGDREIVSVLV